jgi:DNA-binding NarL/FixJ family response regulator
MPQERIDVIIGGRSGLMREGLAALLQEPKFAVVGSSASMSGYLHFARQRKWDAALILDDINPDCGLTLQDLAGALEAEQPEGKVVVLMGLAHPLTSEEHTHACHLIWPQNTLLAGVGINSVSLKAMLMAATGTRSIKSLPASGRPMLTVKDCQILKLIAEGLSNKEIAAETGTAIQTVKNHVSRLLQKLEMQDRVQLAVYAIDQLRGGAQPLSPAKSKA